MLESPKYAAVRQEAEAEIQKLEKNMAVAESVVHARYLGDEVGRLKLLISKSFGVDLYKQFCYYSITIYTQGLPKETEGEEMGRR